MRVVLHDRLRKPQKLDATRIIVEDNFGNPIGVFLEVEPGHVIAEIADNQEKFTALLRRLGINKTLIVDTLKPNPAAQNGISQF